MPYAICQDCNKILTRSGGRGSRLADLCCPACGGSLRNHPTPPELLAEDPHYPEHTDLYQQMGRAVERWLYEARRNDEA